MFINKYPLMGKISISAYGITLEVMIAPADNIRYLANPLNKDISDYLLDGEVLK